MMAEKSRTYVFEVIGTDKNGRTLNIICPDEIETIDLATIATCCMKAIANTTSSTKDRERAERIIKDIGLRCQERGVKYKGEGLNS